MFHCGCLDKDGEKMAEGRARMPARWAPLLRYHTFQTYMVLVTHTGLYISLLCPFSVSRNYKSMLCHQYLTRFWFPCKVWAFIYKLESWRQEPESIIYIVLTVDLDISQYHSWACFSANSLSPTQNTICNTRIYWRLPGFMFRKSFMLSCGRGEMKYLNIRAC